MEPLSLTVIGWLYTIVCAVALALGLSISLFVLPVASLCAATIYTLHAAVRS